MKYILFFLLTTCWLECEQQYIVQPTLTIAECEKLKANVEKNKSFEMEVEGKKLSITSEFPKCAKVL